ncbi:MAG: OadG family protein [Ignavibacteriaceae bacterium]|nr:OadG family protein [Ignavibacteriaceae bacterium]
MYSQITDSVAVFDTAAAMETIHENAHLFQEIDPIGIGITSIGMIVVFSSLLLLFVAFKNLVKVLNYIKRIKSGKKGESISIEHENDIHSGEVNAAIAMALYLYSQEQHDQESLVLTINKVARTYSPWSSKIYGLRQHPRA